MTLESLRVTLGWISIVNLIILLWWFLTILFIHDWVYHLHRKWFNLSVPVFDAIHYSGITFFKMLTFMFNIVPYAVLTIVGI